MTTTEDPYNVNRNFRTELKLKQKPKTQKPRKDKVDDDSELPGDGGVNPPFDPILPAFELPGEGGMDPPKKPIKP
jgi:hypothetical protein